MELKKKFIGSFVYVKELGRQIEVKEENKEKLIRFKHLYDIPKKAKRKLDRSNSKGDDNNIEPEVSI